MEGIKTGRTFVFILVPALILAVAGLFVPAAQILLLIFGGVLFGIFFGAIISFLERRSPLTYQWSFAVVVTLFLALCAGTIYYMGSQAVMQFSSLSEELQSALGQLRDRLGNYPQVQQYISGFSGENIASETLKALPILKTGMNWVLWAVSCVFIVFFLGVYLSFDPHLYEVGIIKMFPCSQRERARTVLQKLRKVLGFWIIGRLASMTIVGVVTAIYLYVLGVAMPVSLAVLAALLTFIPNFGPILATVPQALLALQVSTRAVILVVLFNLILQVVESYLITPLIQKHQVTLPPALTICTQLLLGALFGVLGVILAAPLAAALMLLTQTLYIRDRLGDTEPGSLAKAS